jgi:superkiller protein 3
LSIRPSAVAVRNNLGTALEAQQKLDEAIAAFREAIEIDPELAEAYNNLGRVLRAQKKLDEADAILRKAIEVVPQSPHAHNALGALLSDDLQDYDQAVACFRRAIELNPNLPRTYNNLGITLARQKKLPEAVAAIRKAIELDPAFAPSYSDLGNALTAEGKLDEAVGAYHKAIELDPKFARAYYNLGIALRKLNRPREALDAYTVALEIDPKSANACNGLAWLLATCPDVTLRDPGRAVALAKKGVELDPKNGGYLNTLGVACYRTGDWNGAVANLEKSMELRQGGDSSNWFCLAMAEWQLGNKDAAREWHEKAVEWMEKNAADNKELIRFRAEAAELLGVNEKKEHEPSSAPMP